MKRFLSFLAILGLTTIIAVGCSNKEEAGGEGGKTTINIAHIFPESHPGGIYLDKLAEEVEAKTNGEVTVEIHHNAVLGSEADEIQQIQAGNLDMALLYGSSNFQSLDPVFGVEELPFIFSDIEHVYRAYDGAFGKRLTEMLKEHNFEVLSYWENGFRHFTNNSTAIVEPEDMKGIKFRSAEVPIRLEMFKILGASAIPMGFNELFTALQQGTIDGQENPLSTIDSSKFSEVQEYLSLSGHIYNSAPLVASSNSLAKLTEEQQQIFIKIVEELKLEQREHIAKENETLVEKLKGDGMKVNDINKESFVEAVQPLWEDFSEKNGDELINLILEAK